MKQYVIVATERHEIKYEQNAIRESDEPAIVAINKKITLSGICELLTDEYSHACALLRWQG